MLVHQQKFIYIKVVKIISELFSFFFLSSKYSLMYFIKIYMQQFLKYGLQLQYFIWFKLTYLAFTPHAFLNIHYTALKEER